jgi:polar amino acid transport system substrate-binding protein
MKGLYRSVTALILFLLGSGLLLVGKTAATPSQQDNSPLIVATKPLPPFVIKEGDSFVGFSIELWDAIANELGLSYEFYEVQTVTDQLQAVQNGEADVAIAGITITEQREEVVDFTYPYFDSGLQIMVREQESSPLVNTLRAILSPGFIQYVFVFLLLIVVTAHIFWLFERRHPDFPRSYRAGITQVLWWTTVTVFSHDDKVPDTRSGRLIAVLWMFAGIFLIANLTATLSAGATVRQLRSDIRSIADLRRQRVATAAGTTSANFLQANGVPFIDVPVIDDAYDLLLNDRVDAVVYDAPVLQYYILTSGDSNLQLVGQTFETEKYGIALPTGSPYREPINRATLKLLEDGTYQQLYTRWFGADSG